MRLVFGNRARLVFVNNSRRFVGLVALLCFALPVGLSVAGCSKSSPVVYCNAGDTGPVVGQVATITLSSTLATTGESLNYGQMGQALSASAIDCKGNAVSVKAFTYASTSSFENNTNGGPVFADINPTTGQVCGGLWNRNTGGGIADYTTCLPPSPTPTQYLAYVTASADGATSNAIPVFVHPVVTGVVLGPQSTSCAAGSGTSSRYRLLPQRHRRHARPHPRRLHLRPEMSLPEPGRSTRSPRLRQRRHHRRRRR